MPPRTFSIPDLPLAAYRIGPDKPVFAHMLIFSDTDGQIYPRHSIQFHFDGIFH